jgi:hypothetical protein
MILTIVYVDGTHESEPREHVSPDEVAQLRSLPEVMDVVVERAPA